MEQISRQIVPFINQSNLTVGFQFMISSARVRAARSFSNWLPLPVSTLPIMAGNACAKAYLALRAQ